jgi:hypothetical protein
VRRFDQDEPYALSLCFKEFTVNFRHPLQRVSRAVKPRRALPRLEELETRLVPAFTWVNRGLLSDNFAAVFGARANLARSVVDAALGNWNRIIINLNQPGGGNNINVTISMASGGTGNGASTSITAVNQGWPTAASITIGRGSDGAGGGWFLDPTPNDNSAFTGTVVNGFSAFAQAGSPAAGLGDLDTVVTHELGHALGISPDSNLRLRTFSANTGVPDRSSGGGIGRYYAFVGPSGYSHLMTSFDSGGGGSDFGQAVHSAAAGDPAYPISFGGRTYVGADDLMNPFYNFSQRRLVSNAMASVLREAYNAIILPGVDSQGTFYAVLNQTTGNLLVRGGSGASNDVTTIDIRGGQLFVGVNVGSPVPGTDLTGEVTSLFPLSAIRSITIQASDGLDTINIERLPARTPVSVRPGRGNDTINLSPVAKNLSNLALTSPVTISGGGPGRDSLNIFDDNSTGDRNGVVFSTEFDYGSPFLSTVVSYDSAVTNLLVSAGSAATVNVRGTAAATEIDRAARVNLGDFFDGVQDIRGPVRIQNTATSQTTLRVDDTSNRGAVTARQSLPGFGFDIISGLAPADISYRGSQTPFVNITLGSGDNTFTFENTNTASAGINTTLNTGPGNNIVNVLRTTGPLSINGGGGLNNLNIGNAGRLDEFQGTISVAGSSTALTIDNSNDPSGNAYQLSSTQMVRLLAGPVINYAAGSLRSLSLTGGLGRSSYTVSGTPAATSVVSRGNGDRVDVSLDDLRGPLTVTSQTGTTTLNVNDQGTASDTTYTLFASTVTATRAGTAAQVDYLGIANVVLNGGTRTNVFTVQGSAAGTSTTINGGAGVNEFVVQPSADQTVLGPLAFHGRPSSNSFLMYDDQPSPIAQSYTLTTNTVSRSGAAPVTYDNLNQVIFLPATVGGNTINVPSVAAAIVDEFVDAANGDTVTIGANQSLASILGPVVVNPLNDNISASVVIDDSADPTPPAGPITFSSSVSVDFQISGLVPALIRFGVGQNTTLNTSLLTGAGDKTFNMQAASQGMALTLNAGSGTNTLDYTGYAGNVLVNLNPSIHAATGFSGISNIQNVKGASGGAPGSYNVLIGNGGNVLTGGNDRRNLLVAGATASTLIGGNGDDILIGGTTNWDADPQWRAAFTAIMAEWTRTDLGYIDRVDHIMNGGGLNDPFLLNASTVFNNGGGNMMLGNNGGAGEMNLFYGLDPTLENTDYNPAVGEIFINV